tara:strand:+ start:530 stop:772 length:243 start_codon:yes stop_codon:yes gene_type:complete
MRNLINIFGTLIIYLGTVDRVTNDIAYIELQDTETLQTTMIELPTKAIPCKAGEGLEIEIVQNGAEVVIRCDLPGCPGEE